jgi:glycosyltransferase involved in cell wall biosynthesis
MRDNGFSGLVRREIFYRKILRKFYEKTLQRDSIDFVFVPYLDYCAYAIGLLGSPFGDKPWAGLVMRPAFHYHEMGIIGPRSLLLMPKKYLFYKLLADRRLRALFTDDISFFEYFNKRQSLSKQKIYYLPDPAEFKGNIKKETARKILGIPEDAIVLLVYGTINYRKGVDSLLYAAAHPDFPSNVHILLAGRQGIDAASLLRTSLGEKLRSVNRLHEMNKFLTTEEEYMVFKASDIAWLGYRGHYTMSGVLVQAGLMGLPIVACKEGLIGWLTEKYQLGVVFNALEEEAITKTIKQLISDKSRFNIYVEAGKRYFSNHTVNQFISTTFESIT